MVLRIKKNTQPLRPIIWFSFLTIVCLPFHTLTLGGIGLLLVIGAPLLLLSAPPLLSLWKRKRWDPAMLLLILFFLYNIFAYLWTPAFSTYSLYNYIKIVVIVMCLYCQTYNGREKEFLLRGSILSCLILCWFMLTGRNVGYTDHRMTIAVFGVEQDPNYIGYLFLIPMAYAVEQVLCARCPGRKLLFAALAVLILFCVMMTGSRGAFLGIAVVVAVCVITRFRKLSSKILFCLVMALCAAVVYGFVLSLLPESIADRFSIRDVIESRGTNRWGIWANAFRVLGEHPYKALFGFGTGSSHRLLGGWAAHNFFIQLLLEVGIVGLSLFAGSLWIWLRRLRQHDAMAFSVLLGCMAMAMTLSVNTIYYFWLVFIPAIVCSNAHSPGKRELIQ